jgi:hypothetical protein
MLPPYRSMLGATANRALLDDRFDYLERDDGDEHREVDAYAAEVRSRQDRSQGSQYRLGESRQYSLGGGETTLGVALWHPTQQRRDEQKKDVERQDVLNEPHAWSKA